MGRAQRRKQENRLRRLEEVKAAAQGRAGRRRKLAIGTGALVVVALVGLFLILRAAPDGETSAAPDTTGTTLLDAAEGTVADVRAEDGPSGVGAVPAGCPAPDGSDGPRLDFDGPPPMCIDPAAGYTAVFHTSEGEMRFELTPADTPQTVNNFVTLARWGYYDGTLLFRTDPSIDIIQGGSPHTNSPSDPGPGYTIPDEPPFAPDPDTGRPVGPYRYQPGQLVMARSAGFDSGGAVLHNHRPQRRPPRQSGCLRGVRDHRRGRAGGGALDNGSPCGHRQHGRSTLERRGGLLHYRRVNPAAG